MPPVIISCPPVFQGHQIRKTQTTDKKDKVMRPSSFHRGRHGVSGRASAVPSILLLIALLRGRVATTTAFVAVAPPIRPPRFVRDLVPSPGHVPYSSGSCPPWRTTTTTSRSMADRPPENEGDVEGGADLAAQFFRALSDRNISFEEDEIPTEDDEDEEEMERRRGLLRQRRIGGDGGPGIGDDELDDDDDAILREYDVSPVAEGGYELTNEQIYDEVRDRVFESAGAFVELTKGADDAGGNEDDAAYGGGVGVYRPPINVPDSGLTAGEVVELGELEWREKGKNDVLFCILRVHYLVVSYLSLQLD